MKIVKNYNFKVYEFMRENGGYDNWKLEVLEKYPCDNKIQLRIREQYYYDLLNPTLNTNRPYISEEEIKKYNKEYDAKYKEEHRDEILKRKNQKHICECGGNYTTDNKSQHCKTKKHKSFIEKKIKTI